MTDAGTEIRDRALTALKASLEGRDFSPETLNEMLAQAALVPYDGDLPVYVQAIMDAITAVLRAQMAALGAHVRHLHQQHGIETAVIAALKKPTGRSN